MEEFFSSRLLRWLLAPARGGILGLAARPFTQIADRILGTQFLQDITEFFLSLHSMHGGFVERARAVSRLLSDDRTSFLVVATPEAAPLREAEFFLRELASRRYEVGALVLNRALPPSLSELATEAAADELASSADTVGSAAAAADRPRRRDHHPRARRRGGVGATVVRRRAPRGRREGPRRGRRAARRDRAEPRRRDRRPAGHHGALAAALAA